MINNSSICAAPWVHLFGFGDDKIYPCCKSKAPVGSIQKNSIKEIWNSPEIREMRTKMLKGEKISSCETCYLNENRWNDSYRKTFNKKYFYELEEAIKKTDSNGFVEGFDLKYIDLRFSNLCNFKCIMCSGFYSTSWYKDENLLERDSSYKNIDGLKENNYFKYMKDELPQILKPIERINFAGGEPFLVKEYLDVLDELKKQNKLDTEITFNTNLSILPKEFLLRLKDFKKITIRASLDGYGKKGEFIRKGLDWNRFIKNKILMNKELPHADIRIYCTVQVLNIYHVLDLYNFLIKSGFIAKTPNKFHISFVETPGYYNIRILDKKTKELVQKYYSDKLKDFTPEVQSYLNRIIIYMNESDIDMKKEFKFFTNKLDIIRKQNTKEMFPELSSFFDYVDL